MPEISVTQILIVNIYYNIIQYIVFISYTDPDQPVYLFFNPNKYHYDDLHLWACSNYKPFSHSINYAMYSCMQS